ncbi:phage tail protein I [Salmonella enterica]|nr:phage tail protein I [Salmonella enterica]EDV3150621.1 phage tail protein I [Salmonella enterica subsp. enterica serovar Chandans]ECQ8661082.1 phage tail protein I [Salmonella enterica]EDA0231173.1 phage tail protein I [Salmonella enterica]EDG2099683.1 phage tail protein I [Salmonella enterica]
MADRRDLPLPPPLEKDTRFRILAGLVSRLQDIDLTPLLVYLVDLTETTALPWLADQFAITGDNGWNLAESEDARRALIKSAIELHRYKGTPWSVRQVVRNLGFGEIEIIEGGQDLDVAIASRYPPETHWALYRIKLTRPVTNDQAGLLRKTLEAFAPARCELASLDFVEAAIRYNDTARYDGTYNHGSA